MHIQYHKKRIFEKEKTSPENNPLFFSMNDSF